MLKKLPNCLKIIKLYLGLTLSTSVNHTQIKILNVNHESSIYRKDFTMHDRKVKWYKHPWYLILLVNLAGALCSDVWSNMILDASVGVLLDEINI